MQKEAKNPEINDDNKKYRFNKKKTFKKSYLRAKKFYF